MKDENAPLFPYNDVTIMPTAPVLRVGVIQVIVVLFTTLREVADNPPNVTDVAPVKFVPVIITLIPPSVLPYDGEILVITGGII